MRQQTNPIGALTRALALLTLSVGLCTAIPLKLPAAISINVFYDGDIDSTSRIVCVPTDNVAIFWTAEFSQGPFDIELVDTVDNRQARIIPIDFGVQGSTYKWTISEEDLREWFSADLQLSHKVRIRIRGEREQEEGVSREFELILQRTLNILTKPDSRRLCEGDSTALFVEVEGAPPEELRYAWFDAANPNRQIGAEPELRVHALRKGDVQSFFVRVSADCANTVESDSFVVAVRQEVKIEPSGIVGPNILCTGQNAELRARVFHPNPGELRFEWYEARNPNEILGTDSLLSIKAGQPNSILQYILRIVTPCGDSVESEPFDIQVLPGLQLISRQQQQVEVCLGKPLILRVLAEGSGLQYFWSRRNEELNVDGPELTIDRVSAADAGQYSITITDHCGNIVNAGIALQVITPPTITMDFPAEEIILTPGEPFELELEAEGSGLRYTWFKNGEVIDSAREPLFRIPATGTDDAGTYHVVLSNSCGSDQSRTVLLSFEDEPLPAITVELAAGLEARVGETVALELVLSSAKLQGVLEARGLDQLRFDMAFNGTVAIPLNTEDRGRIEAGIHYCTIERPVSFFENGKLPVNVPLLALLGDLPATEIAIDNLRFVSAGGNEAALPEQQYTLSLNITNVWYDERTGRWRLLNPLKGDLELNVSPNPAGSEILVDPGSAEPGTFLYVFNSLGVRLLDLSDRVGSGAITLNNSAYALLPPGVYFVRLSTATNSVVSVLIVE